MREGFGTVGFATSRSAVIAERSLFQAFVKTNHLRSTYLISSSSSPKGGNIGLEAGSATIVAGMLFGAQTVGRNA